jgi:hypothetical protein
MFTIAFNVDSANTLEPHYIGNNDSGWLIEGRIHEDYYEWVNEFEADHPIFGKVWGDFEDSVNATSEEGYKHFIANHPPKEWDYADI